MRRSCLSWKVIGPLSMGVLLIFISSCSPTAKMGDAIVAQSEIGSLESQLTSEERYRITERDISSLRENGLLDSKSEAALKELQNNPN